MMVMTMTMTVMVIVMMMMMFCVLKICDHLLFLVGVVGVVIVVVVIVVFIDGVVVVACVGGWCVWDGSGGCLQHGCRESMCGIKRVVLFRRRRGKRVDKERICTMRLRGRVRQRD